MDAVQFIDIALIVVIVLGKLSEEGEGKGGGTYTGDKYVLIVVLLPVELCSDDSWRGHV